MPQSVYTIRTTNGAELKISAASPEEALAAATRWETENASRPAAAPAPTEQPRQRNGLMDGLGDAWESLTSGAGQLAQNFEGIDRAVFGDLYNSRLFDWERNMADSGERMQDRAVERMTPERQAEREAGGISPQNIFHGLLESAPAMVPSMVAGAGGTLIGGPGLGVGLMSAVEGLQGAGSTNDQIIDELMAQGYSEAEAANAARLPSVGAGVLTGAIGRFMPGFETDFLTDPLKMSLIRGVTRGVLDEGIEEGLQSGGEQLFTNVGVGQLDQTRGIFDNVGRAALEGAVLGGVGGGAFGGTVGGINDLARLADRTPASTGQLVGDMIQENVDQRRWDQQRAAAAAQAAQQEQSNRPTALPYDRTSPQAVPPTPAPIRDAVDQVSWREQVAPVLDQMAQGNYETLLAEQQDRLQEIERARAGKKRQPKPLPDPIPPRPESQLKADPFTPEMGAELIRSAEAGPVTASMLKDKGIPRPSDTLKILERRGFIKQTGTSENTTKLKNGKTRTVKEPVYESTAAKPPEVAGPGEGTELYIKPVPVQEQAPEGKSKGPTPQAIKARFDAARTRADDTRRKLAALPQVGEDWPASRVEAMDSRRKALEDQLQDEEFEVARAQTGRAAFAVVEKISAPDGAPRENAIQTFPTRQKAQEWLAAKQGPAAPDIQSTPENKTAGRNARQEKVLKTALKGLGLSDDVVLKVESHLDEGAAGYAETSKRNEEGESIEVLVALAQDVYDPNLSDAENLAKMVETLHHEVVHAIRKLGRFTGQEWNLLGKEVRSRKKDGKEYTYLQWAFERYADTYLTTDGKPDMDSIVEEAVAEMTKDWHTSGGKLGARYTGLMNKIIQFFKQLLKMQRADNVLGKIVSGEIGSRTRQTEGGPDQRMFSAEQDGLPVPADRRFSFAGEKSLTAPWQNLSEYLRMENNGINRGASYYRTGWFRGPDGKLRYEMSTAGAKLKRPDLITEWREKLKTRSPHENLYLTLADILDYDELYIAYPEMAGMGVQVEPGTPLGNGRAGIPSTAFGSPYIYVGAGPADKRASAMAPDDALFDALIHEIQHHIQAAEDFSNGIGMGGVDVLSKHLPQLRRAKETFKQKLIAFAKTDPTPTAFWKEAGYNGAPTLLEILDIKEFMSHLSWSGPEGVRHVPAIERLNYLANYYVYMSYYGEMEARNSTIRKGMSLDDRKRTAPWRTFDVDESRGISMTWNETVEIWQAMSAAPQSIAAGVSEYNARNGFTPLETIENLQALAEKNRAAGLNDVADEMLEMASYVDPTGIHPDNIPRISDRRFSYAGARIHSRLGQVINAQTTKKASAEQWLKTLASQPGVAKDEMDWVGFSDLLSEDPSKVMTLEELKQFFEEKNIVLEDIKRGPGSIEDPVDKEMFDAMVEEIMDNEGVDREQAEGAATRALTTAADWDPYQDHTVDDGLVANHSNYTLRGGHTETELLITIPGIINPQLKPMAFRAVEHFKEYNVLAHVRFKIRDDTNGVPTLFIEEIQSDWHQRLRRSNIAKVKGAEAKRVLQAEQARAIEFYEKNMAEPPDFTRTGSHNVLSRFARASGRQFWPDRQTHEAAEAIRLSLREAQNQYDKIQLIEMKDTPSDAPFKNNAWVKLATRRIILDAIDNGITQIGWTPGHIQVERYDNDPSVKGVGKFYDDVVTSIIGKEIKAYGAQINTRQFDIPEGDHPTSGAVMPARILDAPTFHITPKMREVANGEGFRLYSKGAALPRGMTEEDLKALETVIEAKGGMPESQQAAGGAGAAEMAARYTIVQDYLARGTRLSPIKVAEEDAKDALDRATTLMQDRMFPVRRMVSEVLKFGGRVTDTNDPVLADTLYTRRSQHRLDKAHENLYRPAYLAIQQIGATEADLKRLASISNAAQLELESSHVHPSEAVMNLYLYARHAPERNAYIEKVRQAKKIDPDTGQVTDEMLDAGSGMTNEEAAAIMAWFDGYAKQSKVIAAAKKVDAILDYTRSTRETSGLAPRWDEIESDLVPRFEHYVPLRGFAVGNLVEDWFTGDEHARTGKAYKVGGKEDRSMKGRQTYAGDMLANVIMQNQEAIVRSEKVRVGQALARFVRDNPELTKDYLVELPSVPMQRVVVNGKTRMSPKDVKGDPNYFVTKENGKDVVFEVKNARLGTSLSKVQSFGGSLPDLILSRMARLTRLMSQLQTSYNPEFLVANFLRDVQAAMIQSGQYSPEAWDKIGKKAMTYAVRAIGDKVGKTDLEWRAKHDRLSELGGLTGVYGLTSIEDQMQQITKELQDIDPQDKNGGAKAMRLSMKAMGNGFKYLESLNDAVEGATRVAVFEAFREQGWSEERSAQAAKDMTVNFNRKGEWGPYMNAAYMFFNAATQGTATLMQAATSPRVQKIIVGIVLAGALQEMLMSALSPEDEYGTSEYDKIEDYILEKNMIVMLGNGNYLKIPMPLGYNVFHTAGRNMARLAMGKSGAMDAAASTGSSVLSAFNPFGTNGSWVSAIFPSVVRPVVEATVNADFTGKPIHPQGMPGMEQPASQSFFPGASEWSQGVADVAARATGGDGAWTPGALEVHPDDVDHMASSYLGGMGRFLGRAGNLIGFAADPQSKALEGRELAARDMPFYRSFAGNVSGASVRTSYDQLITPYLQFGKSVDQFEAEGNFEAVNSAMTRSPERMMIYDFAADMERDRIKARREINEIQDDPYMDDASKVAIIKQLRDEEQVLMNLTIQQIREMERQAGL